MFITAFLLMWTLWYVAGVCLARWAYNAKNLKLTRHEMFMVYVVGGLFGMAIAAYSVLLPNHFERNLI